MVGVAAGFVGVAVLLYFTSAYFHAATSDSATIALEGQSVANGQLLLHGWDLTFASYWTSNALIDAAVVSFAGLGSAVLYAGPAVVGAVVVVAGASLVREGRRLWAVVAGITAVVALLVCGVPAMEFFFVGHGFHVGTIAYALVAFAALRRTRAGWGWALAVVALAAGILGDLLMIAYGVMPIFLAGLLGAGEPGAPVDAHGGGHRGRRGPRSGRCRAARVHRPRQLHGGLGTLVRLSRPDAREPRARARLRGRSFGPWQRGRHQWGIARPARGHATISASRTPWPPWSCWDAWWSPWPACSGAS